MVDQDPQIFAAVCDNLNVEGVQMLRDLIGAGRDGQNCEKNCWQFFINLQRCTTATEL